MDFIIKELDESVIRDVIDCKFDGEREVDSKLILSLENNRLTYTPINVSPYMKRYPPDEFDYDAILKDPEKTAFIAYVDGRVAGQIILRRNWNLFACLEEFVVNIPFRRGGIGKALLSHGVEWAKQRGMAGVMCETQDNNVAACRLYQSCGFTLKGYDNGLYGASPYKDEIALFWYLNFGKDKTTA